MRRVPMTCRGGVLSLPVLAALCATAPVFAQGPVERNLPEPAGHARVDAIPVAGPGDSEGDDTPLGVDTRGIVLIGAGQEPPLALEPGVFIAPGAIAFPPGAEPAHIEARLAPFLGQPLSRKLIAEMQSALAMLWREAGYPLVSITVPPQDVTDGVLTLRLVEFTAGEITVETEEGASTLPRHLRLKTGLRLHKGARIAAPPLNEDLDWINRNPYRSAHIIFAPGDEEGSSDIALRVSEGRPFSVYASWANTGAAATGDDRWALGGGLWFRDLNDLTLSYQLTRSGEIWETGDILDIPEGRAGYLSHAGRIDLPLGARQLLSVAPNYVKTNEVVEGTPFSFENEVFELPIVFRMAGSNILPGFYGGDIYFAVEPKRLRRWTSFAGVPVGDAGAELFNLVAGCVREWSDPYGQTMLDIRLKANFDGIGDKNSAAAWAAFTGGRVTDHRYVYASLDATRLTALPGDAVWSSLFSGLAAGQALPDSERIGLGGHQAVRGYKGDDAAVDTGFVWRNEGRLPAFSPAGAAGIRDQLVPFGFFDFGYGYDFAAKQYSTVASAGFGIDYVAGASLSASFVGAVALRDQGMTQAGDWGAIARVQYGF